VTAVTAADRYNKPVELWAVEEETKAIADCD